MSADKFDYSLLEEAFELYARERYATLGPEEEKVTFSPAFEERMEKLIRRQKKPYYLLFNTVGKRVASVVIALLIGLAVTTFSVKALRDPFLRFITEVYEKFTSIIFIESEAETDPLTFEKKEPQHIPEGYAVGSVTEQPKYYICDGQNPILYQQQRKLNAITAMDTENTEHKTVNIKEWEGVLCINKDTIALTLCTEQYKFSLFAPSTLSEEELIRMAESLL